jgi:hypothetical protein
MIIDAGTASSSPFQRTRKIDHHHDGIVFTFRWNPRSRCAGNREHHAPEYAPTVNLRWLGQKWASPISLTSRLRLGKIAQFKRGVSRPGSRSPFGFPGLTDYAHAIPDLAIHLVSSPSLTLRCIVGHDIWNTAFAQEPGPEALPTLRFEPGSLDEPPGSGRSGYISASGCIGVPSFGGKHGDSPHSLCMSGRVAVKLRELSTRTELPQSRLVRQALELLFAKYSESAAKQGAKVRK